MKFAAVLAFVAAVDFESMNEDELLAQLSTTLNSAQRSEARGDSDAAVAKTAAIKNIQKALTARILKRLDDGQPLVEVARKMKAIEACSHKSTIWREDSVSCNPLNQFSRTPSRPSKRLSMSEEWARNEREQQFEIPNMFCLLRAPLSVQKIFKIISEKVCILYKI